MRAEADAVCSGREKELAALRAQLPAWEGPAPQDDDLIPWFEATTTGLLPNGMRYYYRENHEPRERVELSVLVRAGSIDEAENERGLAHIIEHLAFRASKEEKGSWGVMRELEQRGVKFGSHQNAYTSFEETVYWLHVPTSFLRRSLDCLAALVLDMRLSQEDLDAERPIVMEEWRQGKDWAQRASEAHFRRLFAGTKLASRLPIGTQETIQTAPASRAINFYERHYRPSNMAIVVVGDCGGLSCDDVVAMLQGAFGKYTDQRSNPVLWPRGCDAYEIDNESVCSYALRRRTSRVLGACRVSIFDDAEATQTSCSVSTPLAWRPTTTIGMLREFLADDVFHIVLNRRLQKRALEARPPFSSAAASLERPMALCADEDSDGRRAVSFASITVEPTRRALAADALTAAWREIERARVDGFAEAEIDVARVELLTELIAQYKERHQTESSIHSDECRDAFLLGVPVAGAEYEVKLTARLLDDMTAVDVQRRADVLYASDAPRFVAVTRPSLKRSFFSAFWPKAARDLDEADFKAAVARSTLEDMTSIRDIGSSMTAAQFFAATRPPGSVAVRTEHSLYASSDAPKDSPKAAIEMELANGMRVIFLRTAFRDDEIVGHGVAACGLSEVLAMKSRSTLVAARASTSLAREYGLFGMPKSEVIDCLGGRRINVSPGVDSYRRSLDCDCSADDFERMLAMIHRLFCVPLRRDNARRETFLELSRESVEHELKDPKSRFAAKCDELDFGKHPFFERLDLYDLADNVFDARVSADFFDAAFGQADGWTLSLIGALPSDDTELERLANTYLASIPRRRHDDNPFTCLFSHAKPQAQAAPLGVSLPTASQRAVVRFSATGESNNDLQSCGTRVALVVAVDGQGDKQRRLAENLRLDLCALLLEHRLVKRLRLEASAVYDVSARASFAASDPLQSDSTALTGLLSIAASHDPAFIRTFERVCLDELQSLAFEGPDKVELDAVLECAQNDRQESFRRNSYWAHALSRTYLTPRFQGDLAATYADTVKTRDNVHAQLRNNAEDARRILSATFRSAIRIKQRTTCALLPRSPHTPVLLTVGVTAAAVALGVVVINRPRRV